MDQTWSHVPREARGGYRDSRSPPDTSVLTNSLENSINSPRLILLAGIEDGEMGVPYRERPCWERPGMGDWSRRERGQWRLERPCLEWSEEEWRHENDHASSGGGRTICARSGDGGNDRAMIGDKRLRRWPEGDGNHGDRGDQTKPPPLYATSTYMVAKDFSVPVSQKKVTVKIFSAKLVNNSVNVARRTPPISIAGESSRKTVTGQLTEKIQAAYYFFFYTFIGSVFMRVPGLMWFNLWKGVAHSGMSLHSYNTLGMCYTRIRMWIWSRFNILCDLILMVVVSLNSRSNCTHT